MNTEAKNQQFYKTSDLGLSTTISLYFPIRTIDNSNPQRVFFIFDQTDELNQFIDSYWSKELKVEPQTFISQIKTIKTRIYSLE